MSPLTLANPDEVNQEENTEKPKKKFDLGRILNIIVGFVALGIVAAPVVLGWNYSGVTTDTQLTITQSTNDITVLDVNINKEKAKNAVNVVSKQTKIDQLTSPPIRVVWSNVVSELERVVHDTTAKSQNDAIFSFTSYTAQADGSISINGFTNSYSAIADLIETLEASPKFEHVKFTSTSRSKDNIVTLNLTFRLEQPAPNPKKTDTASQAQKPVQPQSTQPVAKTN